MSVALVEETALVERIRRNVIGDDRLLPGPFGPRRVVYADWTASGRALRFVEDAIAGQVLPSTPTPIPRAPAPAATPSGCGSRPAS
jgi:hypothetical protein